MQIQTVAQEILLSSYQVTHQQDGDVFEFILNEDLYVMECVRIKSLYGGIPRVSRAPTTGISPIGLRKKLTTMGKPIPCSAQSLDGFLFELNHVRVNPELDNTFIIQKFTQRLKEIDVKVTNQPKKDSMAICYKPLGEIADTVRFYMDREGKLVFLSPATRPRLVYSRQSDA